MKRLTTAKHQYPPINTANIGDWMMIYDRLAEYEDTGRSPEEIEQFTLDPMQGVEIASLLNELQSYRKKQNQGLLYELPCRIGDTVYRICPKCNDAHNGTCLHCAWSGTAGPQGCDVFGMWENGQFPPEQCTILTWTVRWNNIPLIEKWLGKRVFLSMEEAEAALNRGV